MQPVGMTISKGMHFVYLVKPESPTLSPAALYNSLGGGGCHFL